MLTHAPPHARTIPQSPSAVGGRVANRRTRDVPQLLAAREVALGCFIPRPEMDGHSVAGLSRNVHTRVVKSLRAVRAPAMVCRDDEALH
jgi:hypothetical protein